jgi:hypothetical protein
MRVARGRAEIGPIGDRANYRVRFGRESRNPQHWRKRPRRYEIGAFYAGWVFAKQDNYRDPNTLPTLEAMQATTEAAAGRLK